ncbi:hypothetical protein BOSE62_150422 [Bosea sp. 62]|nr:hypothetical protein BOSE46_10421 [Bosea sp. 46]CAD5250288.1 hypothetical protein BOSE21B_10634 [Bosea sp. 21B]CAD5264914.1 hypothetical protein BOSE7B_150503 [Bosea sp. 7B]VVT44337.1 hypothetical protein BOS5A_10438 [Bosea sp. EC-HK365B]VXB09885.1 hypothetical protein BOSE29B_10417 [Bosea sp. 29B]VXB82544.1 hypothetical protein BOSE62_150422 [Bosea sp. 62]VXC32109.1 hypothetical protein BOSE125_20100 [Bosea sp. 125]VXC44797.1 hypothetical protein BOSE127_190130 [Bosea sp. 127]
MLLKSHGWLAKTASKSFRKPLASNRIRDEIDKDAGL